MSSPWRAGELDELFSGLVRARAARGGRRAFQPPIDVFRTDDPRRVIVVADLAGIDPSDVELSFADGVLTLAGLRRRPQRRHAVYQQMELEYGPFERRVAVGQDVDPGGASAAFDRGLLTVWFPLRARPSQPMRVVIAVVRQP